MKLDQIRKKYHVACKKKYTDVEVIELLKSLPFIDAHVISNISDLVCSLRIPQYPQGK